MDNKHYTRRDFGKLALAGLPASYVLANLPLSAAAKINSKFKGVQIGAITYSFRTLPNPDDIIAAYVKIGLGEMELMSGDAEKLAGAPQPPARTGGAGRPAGAGGGGRARGGARAGEAGGAPAAAPEGGAPAAPAGGGAPRGRGTPSPEQVAYQEALQKFRMSATENTFKPVRQKIENAGIDLRLLTYNMNVASTKDDEIEYAFTMAKGLGVKGITTSTQVSMAKRVAPFAEKHKLMVGFHGHDMTDRADEVSSEETFKAVMAAGKYLGCNLDIGHYTAANGDPIAFIKQYHDRITNLHLKDRKKDHGANLPWGQGDTPITPVLLLMSQTKYDFPCNIEFEYPGDPLVEVQKCLDYCRKALA